MRACALHWRTLEPFATCSPSCSDGGGATERGGSSTRVERLLDRLSRPVHAEPRESVRAEGDEEQYCLDDDTGNDDVLAKQQGVFVVSAKQSTLPPAPLGPSVLPLSGVSGRVGGVALHSVALDVKDEREHERERVGEVHDRNGCDETRNRLHLGNRGSNHEGKSPVDDRDGSPDNATTGGVECGTLHERLHRVDIDDLETDIAIQRSGDGARKNGEHVADRLERVLVNTIVRLTQNVLSLVGVDHVGIDEVDRADEGLGRDHALPEVHRATHLGHELREDHRATIREHHIHQAVDLLSDVVGDKRRGHDGLVVVGVVSTVGSLGTGNVGTILDDGGHGNDDDDDVLVHGGGSCETKATEGLDLGEGHADEGKDDDAHREAEVGVAGCAADDLAESLAVGKADETDVDDKLKRLESVECPAHGVSHHTLANVAVRLDGVTGRVELHEQLPEDDTAPPGTEAHDDVHDVTRHPSVLGHGVRCTIGTKNIGGDEVEDTDPRSGLDGTVGVAALLLEVRKALELVKGGCIRAVDGGLGDASLDGSAVLADLLGRVVLLASVLDVASTVGSIGLNSYARCTVQLFLLALDLGVEHVLFHRDTAARRGFVERRNGDEARCTLAGDVALVRLLLVGGVLRALNLGALGTLDEVLDTHVGGDYMGRG
ncbi:hypothetical protein L1887_60777 [Cichorium endivia]|nr:hypothetical protein L1887_60777 [Cichorium endivia]